MVKPAEFDTRKLFLQLIDNAICGSWYRMEMGMFNTTSPGSRLTNSVFKENAAAVRVAQDSPDVLNEILQFLNKRG